MNEFKRAVFHFIELHPNVDVVNTVERFRKEYKELKRSRFDVANSPLAKKLKSGAFLRFNHRRAQAHPNKNKRIDLKRCYIPEEQIRLIRNGR